MAYLPTYDSNNDLTLEVFPSTRRVRVQQDARETSEKTITGIVGNFIDYKGFAITQVLDSNGPFEFNIHGYYFKVKKTNDILSLFPNDSQIWATIVIDESNPNYPELLGQDDFTDPDNPEYQGVKFTSTEETAPPNPNSTIYSIQLFNKINSNWYIVNTQKFGPSSVNVIDGIDGGTV